MSGDDHGHTGEAINLDPTIPGNATQVCPCGHLRGNHGRYRDHRIVTGCDGPPCDDEGAKVEARRLAVLRASEARVDTGSLSARLRLGKIEMDDVLDLIAEVAALRREVSS